MDGDEPLILLYHRVATPCADPWELCVTPANFAAQMEVLARTAEVVPLGWRGRPSARKGRVVITFDDGYLDNLLEAKPVLERLALPATVFIMTAGMDRDHEPWWDRLERALSGSALRTANSRTNRPPNAAYMETWRRLRDMTPQERDAELEMMLASVPPQPQPGVRPRLMRAQEIALLAAGGLVDVGAHTISHPSLARLPADLQLREISQSRCALREIVGGGVQAFSYPFGTREHYTEITKRLVRDAGFRWACAGATLPYGAARDRLELPRVPVTDLAAAEFEHWLRYTLERAA